MVAVEVASSHIVSAPHPASKDRYDGVDHLLEGKRHLLVQDFPSASDSLARACKFLADKYGEMANECADAYFHYAKTLLQLGRMEAGVLGNALNEAVEKINEEKEDVDVKVMEALEENFVIIEEKISELLSGHTKRDCDDEEDEDDMEDEEVTYHDGDASGIDHTNLIEYEYEEAMETEMSAGEKKNMEDEDPSNLERAKEILDRSIYSRMVSFLTNIWKLCDTLLALNSCLEKNKDKLPNNMIAEVLGVAIAFHKKHEELVKVLNKMLDTLKADTFNARVGEGSLILIDELEKLITEIREKIQAGWTPSTLRKKLRGDSSSGFSSSDMPASSIEPKRK